MVVVCGAGLDPGSCALQTRTLPPSYSPSPCTDLKAGFAKGPGSPVELRPTKTGWYCCKVNECLDAVLQMLPDHTALGKGFLCSASSNTWATVSLAHTSLQIHAGPLGSGRQKLSLKDTGLALKKWHGTRRGRLTLVRGCSLSAPL